MKLLTDVPKKSVVAAACVAVLLLWGLPGLLGNLTFLFRGSFLSVSMFSAYAPLLGYAVLVWYLVPGNRHYRLGLEIVLGGAAVLAALPRLLEVFQAGWGNPGQMLLLLLGPLLSPNIILFAGLLARKSTERIAAASALAWPIFWVLVNLSSESLTYILSYAAVSLLQGLLLAAALWLHPVLERPMLEKIHTEEEPHGQ